MRRFYRIFWTQTNRKPRGIRINNSLFDSCEEVDDVLRTNPRQIGGQQKNSFAPRRRNDSICGCRNIAAPRRRELDARNIEPARDLIITCDDNRRTACLDSGTSY